MSRFRPGRLSVLLAAVLIASMLPSGVARAAVHTVPSSIPSDCSRNVQAELSNFIASVPAGSTVQFPANGCYAQNDEIKIKDKSDLIIDGGNSTFRNSAENSGRIVAPNWMLVRVRNVRMKNMKLVGNFNLTGARSQQRVNEAETQPYTGNQNNAGVSVYGGDGVWITDMDIRHVFGDGVLTGMSEYVENSAPFETPANVHVERVTTTKAARHCFSPNQVVGFWLQDSIGRDCWYTAIDAELDSVAQSLKNVHILRNTFDGFFMGGIIFPVAGDGENTRDIEIRANKFLTRPDNACNNVIQVGTPEYPNTNTFKNVVVEDNEMKSSGHAVRFHRVAGGSIQHNKIEYTEAGCSYPNVTPFINVTESSAVTVADNGPNATPGSGGTPPPPPSSSCAAPSSVSGTRLPGSPYNNADLSWPASSNATSYNVYIAWHNSGNPPSKYASFDGNSGRIFSLLADKEYDVWITSVCGSTESPKSPMLVLPLSGSATSGGTSPPPSSSCAAPSSVSGTRLPGSPYNNADLSWPASSNATSYNVYIAWHNSGNPPSKYASFDGNSGRIFSLLADKEYDVWITSVCGSTESPKSPMLVLPLSGSATAGG